MSGKGKPRTGGGAYQSFGKASLPCRVLLVNSPELAERLSGNLHDTQVLFADPERLGDALYRQDVAAKCGEGLSVFAPLDLIGTYKGEVISGLQGLLGARLVSIPMTVADMQANPTGLQTILEAKDRQVAADDAEFNRKIAEKMAEEPEPVASEDKPKRNRKLKDDEKPRQVSFLADDDFLYEEVLINGHLTFLRYEVSSGKVESVEEILTEDGTRIIPKLPLDPQELEAVLLPSGYAEYGDTKALLAAIQQFIHRYLDVSDDYLKFASYYVLLSWLYDRMNTLPYLRALGDTGCGKSRLIDTVGRICYKATIVSGSVTSAGIYRMITRWGGTLNLDEADLANSDEYNEVIKILNCGFERGRPVIRADKNNQERIYFNSTFGPKVFGTRRRFKDAALEARCLTEVMQETDRTDIPVFLGSSFYREQEELRNKLLLFRFHHWQIMDPEEAKALDLGSNIEPRLRQISSAFGAVFANMDDVLADYRVFIGGLQRELIEQRASTPVGHVVEILFSLTEWSPVTLETLETIETRAGDKLLKISSGDIAEKMNSSMTAQTVGQILKTLGLKTKAEKVDGKTKRLIVYDPEKLIKLYRRYVPNDEDLVSSVSNVSSVTEEEEPEPEQPPLTFEEETGALV